MTITQWPKNERPREKLLEKGASALTDAELLAIFLRTGVAGKSAVDLARDLLAEFDGLPGLLGADKRRFCQVKGLGQAKFALLQAVLEMNRRYLTDRMRCSDVVHDPEAARTFLKSQLYHRPNEIFACLFLDNRHRVLKYEELFVGTLNSASVYPREVARRALEVNAAATIFAHNHPSGVAEPSQADLQITRELKKSLGLFEIKLLDHFIIGDGGGFSMEEHGLL